MSNQEYSIFDTATKKIDRVVSCRPSEIGLNLSTGEDYIVGEYNGEYFYVESATALPRADYVLESLPLPCTVVIEGIEYPITTQPTFEFDAPGTYEIEVDAGAEYLEKTFHVTN